MHRAHPLPHHPAPTAELETGPRGRPRPHRRSRGPGGHIPVFPESRLEVRPWLDPVLDTLGHDPRSLYVEQFWLSILGPSSYLLLRRLAARLESEPEGFAVDLAQWAAELGLGSKGGQHSPFWRAVERACRFGSARRHGEVLAVRRRLPPLTSRQVLRLPEHLRPAHDAWQAAQAERPRRRTIAHWSDHGTPEPGTPEPGTPEPGAPEPGAAAQ